MSLSEQETFRGQINFLAKSVVSNGDYVHVIVNLNFDEYESCCTSRRREQQSHVSEQALAKIYVVHFTNQGDGKYVFYLCVGW